ncbi:MAG: hypothetical protein V2A34_05040 [Lentisphaerota bacterium]
MAEWGSRCCVVLQPEQVGLAVDWMDEKEWGGRLYLRGGVVLDLVFEDCFKATFPVE